ncbi:MAG TPA: deoxyguanosinetriphosphate triphosphohydrolase [Stellaceae bacterium]|jgi:dGTPase|nr:deoxyguanosinetriphosphate triphosphohydrolase [Stellaceae bacterium]
MTQPALAAYACRPEESRGRLHSEPESPSRSVFQRDRDRIIHCSAFRRLQYKTQVFVYHEGDHYRTRLTHSLEVAQIARTIARRLGLDEDLAEALSLAHDLGHTPFGHAGEEALNEVMKDFGGFRHNDQTLRVLTKLEHRYAAFDGLNLTWETLEGIAKHNGPVRGELTPTMADYVSQHDLELLTWPSAEAQVAALADDIAYDNHDTDDGLRAELFQILDLTQVPLLGPIFAEVDRSYPGVDDSRLIHEAIRRLIDRMIGDVVEESQRRIAALKAQSAADIRRHSAAVIAFSAGMREEERGLRRFLFERMYRHYRVNRMASKARRIVQELFRLLLAEPQCLPTEWQSQATGAGTRETARVVADYIAGMTDRFALDEHYKLFDRYATT